MSGDMIVLSSGERLRKVFGKRGFPQLVSALEDLETRVGIRTFFPDDPNSAAAFDLSARTLMEPGDFRSALVDVHRAMGRADGDVLILGGDQIVPFHRFVNPVKNRTLDPESIALTDAPYSCPSMDPGLFLDRDAYLEVVGDAELSLSIGRLPDFGRRSLPFLMAQVERLRQPLADLDTNIFAVSNEVWADQTLSIIPAGDSSHYTTPSWSARHPDWRTQRSRLLFFNLHGFLDEAPWRGYSEFTDRWTDGLRPRDIDEDVAVGRLVVAENCYGAQIVGKRPNSSIALSFLASGAKGFIGALGKSFGSYLNRDAEIEHADFFAKRLLRLLTEGSTFGESLRETRNGFIREDIGDSWTEYDQKTALQFVLLGDPAARLG